VASSLSNLAWVGALGSKASECVAVIPGSHEKGPQDVLGVRRTISANDPGNEAAPYARAVVDGDIAALDGRLSVAPRVDTRAGAEDGQEGLMESQ
jgi:hypothetical protein